MTTSIMSVSYNIIHVHNHNVNCYSAAKLCEEFDINQNPGYRAFSLARRQAHSGLKSDQVISTTPMKAHQLQAVLMIMISTITVAQGYAHVLYKPNVLMGFIHWKDHVERKKTLNLMI